MISKSKREISGHQDFIQKLFLLNIKLYALLGELSVRVSMINEINTLGEFVHPLCVVGLTLPKVKLEKTSSL